MRAKRFQMQSWSSRELRWETMEEGSVPSVWRPQPSEVEAIAKCLAWTAFLCIPSMSMQVVDLASGRVVWRGLIDPYYHEGAWRFVASEAGPPIGHDDELLAGQIARLLSGGRKPTEVSGPKQAVLF